MKHTLHTLIICFLALALQVAKAQPGHNDPTFNPNDVGNIYGENITDAPSKIARQSDGKFIVGGLMYRGVARLNTDLSIDTSFHTGSGFSVTNTYYIEINAISIQNDGKILVGGKFQFYNGIPCSNIVRLNTDGSLDTTFINYNYFPAYPSGINAIVVQPDGKILVGCYKSNTSTEVTGLRRLNINGSADSTFAVDTTILTVNEILLLNNGQFYIDFTKHNSLYNYTKKVSRMNADGTFDTTFNFNYNIFSNFLVIRALDVQADGKLLICGDFNGLPLSNTNAYLVRFNTDGNRDTTFTPILSYYVNSVKALSNGKILVSGLFGYTNAFGIFCRGLALLNSDGSFDSQFNSYKFPSVNIDLLIENNNSFIVAGEFSVYKNRFVRNVLRIDAYGNLDPNMFQSQGAGGAVTCNAFQSDGKLLIGGKFKSYNGWAPNLLARLNVDGSLDTTFNTFYYSWGTINSIAQQSDGKVLVGGNIGSYKDILSTSGLLIRVLADGTYDSNFKPKLTESFTGLSGNAIVNSVLVLPNNKILVGGDFKKYTTSSGSSFNSWGAIMLGSNGGRLPESSNLMFGNIVNALALQNDSKIIFGGAFTNKIVRKDTLGITDTTFHVGTGFSGDVRILKVQSDGKILAAGSFNSYQGITAKRLARLNTDGSLDSTFSVGNEFFGNQTQAKMINSIELQADDKILVGGYIANNSLVDSGFVCRLNTNGSLDTTFYRGAGVNYIVNSIAVQNNGTAIIGGGFRRYDNYPRNHIARIYLNPCNAPTFTSTTSAHRCDAGVLTLQANANAGTTKWFTVANGGFSVGTGSSFTTPFLNTTKTYYVEATDSNCTSNRIAVTASILGTTINNQTFTICNGSSITVGTNNYNTSGVYVDSLTTALGCDSVVTTTLNIVTNFTSNVSATICAGESYTIAQNSYTTTGVYSDTLTAIGGCDSIVVTNLTVFQNYIINNPQTICAGNVYTFNGNTYTIAGNYNDTLQTINGCDSIVVTQLTVNPLPTAPSISAMGNTTICAGNSLMLMGNNGGIWSNASTTNDITVNVAGNYYVIATNNCGSDTSNVITITVNPLPNTTVLQTTNTLTANQTSATYQWIDCNNNTNISSQTNQSFTPSTNGNYSVAINSNGCVDTSSCYVIVLPDTNCHAQFTLYADTIVAHHYYALNQCTGTGTINYTWSWGDGSANSTGATPSHQYNAPGYYTICVTINDSAGCTNTYCDSSTYITKSMANTIISVDVVNVLPPPITTRIATSFARNEAIQLYPNPVNSILNISGVLNQKLEIQNVLGEIVNTKTNCNTLESIDVSAFAKGVYFVRVGEKSLKFIKE